MVLFLIFGRTTLHLRFKQLLLINSSKIFGLDRTNLNLGCSQLSVPERTSFLSQRFVSNSSLVIIFFRLKIIILL